jgi:hypothetical protein
MRDIARPLSVRKPPKGKTIQAVRILLRATSWARLATPSIRPLRNTHRLAVVEKPHASPWKGVKTLASKPQVPSIGQ